MARVGVAAGSPTVSVLSSDQDSSTSYATVRSIISLFVGETGTMRDFEAGKGTFTLSGSACSGSDDWGSFDDNW